MSLFFFDIPPYSSALAVAFFILVLGLIYPNRFVGTRPCKSLPGPKGLPILGNTLQVYPHRKRMIAWMEIVHRKYGNVFTFSMASWGRTIVIKEPTWLQHIKKRDTRSYSRGDLVISIFQEFPGIFTPVATEGKEWRLSRGVMHPIFTVQAFKLHVSKAMSEIIPVAQDLLTEISRQNLVVDWNDIAGRIALNIFLVAALNLEGELIQADPACLQKKTLLMDAISTLNEISAQRLFNPYWNITELFNGDRKRFTQARQAIWSMVETIMNDRKRKLQESAIDAPSDFLSSLLSEKTTENPLFIRDTLVTVIFGGRDNMQNSLVWSFQEIAKSPEWIAKMREEADNNYRNGQVPDYDDLSAYPIHMAVLYETIRLWPGLPKNARFALVDDCLPAVPGKNLPELPIHKGDYILWSDRLIMRDPEVWGPDAGQFNPARHLDESGKFVLPSSPQFIAFGEGPRRCPAVQLVAYQFVAIWSRILFTHDLIPISYNDEPQLESFTAAMTEPLYIRVQQRPSRPE